MNALSKILRKLGGRNSGGAQEFYGTIAQNNVYGGPNYTESRRDYEAVRRNNARYERY